MFLLELDNMKWCMYPTTSTQLILTSHLLISILNGSSEDIARSRQGDVVLLQLFIWNLNRSGKSLLCCRRNGYLVFRWWPLVLASRWPQSGCVIVASEGIAYMSSEDFYTRTRRPGIQWTLPAAFRLTRLLASCKRSVEGTHHCYRCDCQKQRNLLYWTSSRTTALTAGQDYL